tara:strand:- start:1453 stop:1563 length:111 start_codon:yes stop_codon:yes gene_type:complete
MNITDELFTARREQDSGNVEIDEKISTLIEFIDDSL